MKETWKDIPRHLTQKQIANYFNVHMVTIGDIFNGRSWGHII